MLILGDCLLHLKKIEDNSVDLIYIDPPFFSQKTQTLKTRDNQKEYFFNDKWHNINSYVDYIKNRLIECKRVLKETGSIFLHCDRSASHYLRISLDEVFGFDHFQSEIIWAYKRWSNAKNGLLNCHQIIYFYSKSTIFKFNKTFDAYSPTTNIDQIFQKRTRDNNGKTKYKKQADGNYELIKEKKGVPLSDVWQIPYLNPKANERVGYPTQKPILLLERIIKLVTDENDVVLDPCCGSGTTLVSAKLLKRKYIGIDISKDAIALCKKRLENPVRSDSALLKLGESTYINQSSTKINLLESVDAIPVQRNKGIDGFLRVNGTVRPIPVKIQDESETLDEAKKLLLQASKKNGFLLKILISVNKKIDKKNSFILSDGIIIISNLIAFAQRKDTVISNILLKHVPA
jgi:site-specific DNA-methyltransferase (adenine-specific)